MNIGQHCRVKVFYRLSLGDGEMIEDAMQGEPMEFVFGSGEILPGLERALEGMSENEEKHVELPPEEAYGVWNPQAVLKVPRSEFPPAEEKIEEGMVFRISREDGVVMYATVTGADEAEVTLDLNHPLAGETLHFDIKIAGLEGPAPLIQQ